MVMQSLHKIAEKLQNTIKCEICQSVFRTEKALTEHEFSRHTSKPTAFFCKRKNCVLAGLSFTTPYSLQIHMYNVHKVKIGVQKAKSTAVKLNKKKG